MELHAVQFLFGIFKGANRAFCRVSDDFEPFRHGFHAVTVAHQYFGGRAHAVENFRLHVKVCFRHAEFACLATDNLAL